MSKSRKKKPAPSPRPVRIAASLPVVAPVEFHVELPERIQQPPEITWQTRGKKLVVRIANWFSAT